MLLRLDGHGPRYTQITRALGSKIQRGALKPGTRLPPTRELAVDLGCSRNIVLLAYEQLGLEGYLVTQRGAGTFVSPALPTSAAPPPWEDPVEPPPGSALSGAGHRIVDAVHRARSITSRLRRYGVDFRYGLCEPDARVIRRMRAAFGAALCARSFGYLDPAGDQVLRQQIAERLRGVRGISRPAEQIVITAGAQQALDICARLLVNQGDRVVVEDPGYEAAHAAFAAAGAHVIPVPVDDNGLDLTALPRGRARVRLVYVTPSHQFPVGGVLPAARRYALLEWARRRGAHIIEDDYNGEFRYAGGRIEALAALEADSAVIYCGTFAKSLFPSLRLGYLALPPGLVAPAAACKWLTDRGSPTLLQRVVGELMATGEYDRHIRRMLRRYRARREALMHALQTHLGSAAHIRGGGAGLHVVVWFPHLDLKGANDLVAACQARDVGVYSLAPNAQLPFRRAALLLGYGLVEPEAIEKGVSVLAAAYREVVGNRSGAAAPSRANRAC